MARKRPQTKTQKTTAVAPAERPGAACSFYVVGLGSSAGGLQALREFFGAVPAKSGAAFVVIQHLAPDHSSQMAELLATHTQTPVRQIEDGVTIEPDHVYVTPPGKCVKIFHGKLLLFEPETKAPHLPVDQFFRSLAENYGEMAIAVVLSGTGSDGTLGVRAIKEAGGTLLVQDPTSAKFSGMPDSANATGLADYILPPAEMSCELLKFIRHPFAARAKNSGLKVNETNLQKILSLVHEQTGIDFTDYKPSSVMRRVERRIGIAQLVDPGDYLQLLQQSEQEVAALGRDLLINVTRFFRDEDVFAFLQDEILPALLKRAAQAKKLRIWVPGCATGEEAYAIAMLLHGLTMERDEKWDVKIFATDVDKNSIEYAGRGLYPKSIAADVAPELLARFFTEENGELRISREIREQIVFAQHNILRDPPFTHVDLISCRNLLIYLRANAQQRVMALLHFALRPGGYLVLGTSEALADREDAFDTVHLKMRIFKKRADSTSNITHVLNGGATESGLLKVPEGAGAKQFVRHTTRQQDIWETIGRHVLAEFGTTCFVLNEKHEIVRSFGEPQHFLTIHAGPASLSILKLLPRDLALALSRALRRAAKEKQSVRYSRVRFSNENGIGVIDLKVESLPVKLDHGGAMLVFFQKASAEAVAPARDEFDLSTESIGRIADLEEDLETTKKSLKEASGDRATAQEELQATNEELLAGNEELQSSNEELESVNEELTTLNAEYQQKIAELIVANNDLENFLRTSDVATIFLDHELRLRRFTPAVTREISLQEHDLGRPLTDFAHPLIAAIGADLPQVAGGGEVIMKTVETGPNVWHLVRITPYRREGAADRGLVITILDVSRLQNGTASNGSPTSLSNRNA